MGFLSLGALWMITQCDGGSCGPADSTTAPQTELLVLSNNSLGRVVSQPDGIACGSLCTHTFDNGTTVTLTASLLPSVQGTFVGWDGACSGSAPTCTVTLQSAQTVIANWLGTSVTSPPPALTLVSPASASNAAAVPLTITGMHFAAGTTVTVGGAACGNVQVKTPTQLTCTLPPRTGICGAQTVSVVNSGFPPATSNKLFSLSSSPLTFAAPAALTAGPSPDHILAADFNGDGKLDLVNTNQGDNSVTVFLGAGNGTFAAAKAFGVGQLPVGVASGDFNGDKKLDLVTADYNGYTVSVILGDGQGGFGAATSSAVGATPRGVTVGDVNMDGNADVVVANAGATTVTVLLGDGAGNLTVKSTVTTGNSPYEVALGDLDGDAYLDMVTTNYSDGTASILHGNHDGTFTLTKTLTIGSIPIGLAVADMNADGNLDVITASGGNSKISVALGDGKGNFGTSKDAATGTTPRGFVIGDVNGDHLQDVVVANQDSANVSVLLGNGDGTFQGGSQLNFAVGNMAFDAAIGDFDRDGLVDIATANDADGTLSVLLAQCK